MLPKSDFLSDLLPTRVARTLLSAKFVSLRFFD